MTHCIAAVKYSSHKIWQAR